MTTRAGENRGADWGGRHARGRGFRPGGTDAETSARAGRDIGTRHGGRCRHARRETAKGRISAAFHLQHACAARQRREVPQRWRALRSEEHTSELQSLMRISYAVFCLKNKKKQKA